MMRIANEAGNRLEVSKVREEYFIFTARYKRATFSPENKNSQH